MSRENILHKVRTALGRSAGDPPDEAPAPRLSVPERSLEENVARFRAALEALGGVVRLARTREEALAFVREEVEGKTAAASNSRFLDECGVNGIAGVLSALNDEAAVRQAAATVDAGITSADYMLADTGSLVMIASPEECRLLSLLPPLHLAVVPLSRMLSGLDQLFTVLPLPSARTSSMVFITGPSRTADIEQILVRGVHGPGDIHVILVDDTSPPVNL